MLHGATGLMALALVAVFASSAQHAFQRRATAEHVHAVVSTSRDLFVAMQSLRVERGTGNTSIETATPIDSATQREITALRARSNAALDQALAKITDMGIPATDPTLAQIRAARSEFDHIRATVDAALLLPKNQRPPAISGLWVASCSKLVDAIDAFSERLSGEIRQAAPLITEMMKIKQLAWVARDAAGTDRLQVGAVIANASGVSIEQQLQFATLAGRMNAAWQMITEDAHWLDLPLALQNSVAQAQTLYFDELRPKRSALLEDIAAGRPAAMSGVQWVNLSNPGLEAVMDVADTAFDLSDAEAAADLTAAIRDCVGAVVLTIFFLGFGIFATLIVIRRVARPMAILTSAMRAVANGDLDGDAPFVDRADEIGELARTLTVFREKGRESRRLATELLRQERLSALGQLTATVAHELRNPLSAIRNTVYTFKELAATKGLNIDRPIERVERSIARCDRIIADLLDYTRVRDLHPNAASFDKWLDEVLNDQKLPEGVSLVRNLSAPDHLVSFDADRMRQVVVNLIENAAQAMTGLGHHSTNQRIVVTTAARLNGFELVVADNGPGIAADVLPKIFEPLFSTKSFGTGLGLPMVKQVVEQHGGTVEVASTPGRGTKVTMRLPHAAALPDAQEIAA
ncbi:MAG TPA: ATP-binding protein [Stellaceae bacterium]|nr:ATP-binding protein [Stellaceae bacterium]